VNIKTSTEGRVTCDAARGLAEGIQPAYMPDEEGSFKSAVRSLLSFGYIKSVSVPRVERLCTNNLRMWAGRRKRHPLFVNGIECDTIRLVKALLHPEVSICSAPRTADAISQVMSVQHCRRKHCPPPRGTFPSGTLCRATRCQSLIYRATSDPIASGCSIQLPAVSDCAQSSNPQTNCPLTSLDVTIPPLPPCPAMCIAMPHCNRIADWRELC
jgi:hypothetical protein